MVYRDGPWAGVEDVEWATLTYVHWFNNTRLHGAIGMVPPAELEQSYYAHTNWPVWPALTQPSLYETQGGSVRLPWHD